MRDAIVVSGWTWEASNVPERMALALGRAGARVLYCENPTSIFRAARTFSQVEQNVFAFGLQHGGHRLNTIPFLGQLQAKILAEEILQKAARLKLKDPVFVYPHGDYCLLLCREFKRRNFQLIHVCMDYELELVRDHVAESDLTLVIPQMAFEKLRDEFGPKVRKIPQFSYTDEFPDRSKPKPQEMHNLSQIPKPRLGYLGGLEGRLSFPLLEATLRRHPEWQFLSFGRGKRLGLSNEHVLSWRERQSLVGVLAWLDIGFMPYDCAAAKNLHCVPLKLFDYFSVGLPVVSTPITFLRDYEDLVYLGNTVEELEQAISKALAELPESPKRAKRVAVARAHSIQQSSRLLVSILNELGKATSAPK